MKDTKRVVAALIWDSDGRFMICKRPPDKLNPLLWEFAGGKVEPGESDYAALERELKEELELCETFVCKVNDHLSERTI